VSEWVETYGLVALFLVLAIQAAGGPGPPGKTALVVASLLAADGRMVLWQVLTVAAAGVAAGGFVGYAVGRRGGRRLLERWWPDGRLAAVLAQADAFFDRHGAKSVFLARFVPGFKVVVAPAAGVARMRLTAFAPWHLLGAIVFAVAFGLLGYFAGAAAVNLVEEAGVFVAAALVVVALIAAAVYWWLRRRRHLDRGTLEALDHAGVGRRSRGDRGLDLARAVEVAAPVRVERGDGRRVVREPEAVHAPASAVVSGVARRGRGDVGLQPEELVDRVEAAGGRPGAGEIRGRPDGPVQDTVDVEGRSGHAARPGGERAACGDGQDDGGEHGERQ
jgi:membrane protein DedA with SNARE-associated domain